MELCKTYDVQLCFMACTISLLVCCGFNDLLFLCIFIYCKTYYKAATALLRLVMTT